MNLKVNAFQVADSIEVKQFKTVFAANIYYEDTDELFYQIDSYKYVYVFKYGIVSFLGYNEVEMTAFFQIIAPYCKNLFEQRLIDEFDIETGSDNVHFRYNKLEIPKPDNDMIRIIMLNVSQSVALAYYFEQTKVLLEETSFHTRVMLVTGKI